MIFRSHHTHHSFHQIIYILKTTRLFSVSINGYIFILQCLYHKIGNYTSVIGQHIRTIRIEYADYFYQNAMLTVIIHAQSLGTTFSFIITRPVAYGIHISPISLPLGMRQRITIHLTGRSLKYFCFVTLRQSQHIKRAEDSRLRRFDSIMLIMYRRSGTCQIVYLVHIRPKRINYIVFYQFKARMPDQVTYILFTPREKVV